MKTETIIGLNQKLLLFQAKVNAIKKDGKNPHFKNSYTTINEILSEVKPLLTELGLVLIQPIEGNKVATVITDCDSKESITSFIELPNGLNPQQIGGAITYFRRYNLTSLLALESTDDDGVEATELPFLNKNTENYYKVVDALTNGKATINQVKTKYKLSKELETELNKINK